MALSIKDDEADRLARELAGYTGETLTEAVVVSLKERLERVRPRSGSTLVEDVERIARRVSQREILDHRTADEILGYDANGLPT
ncbi:MAG: type II toxin-antitoxin system VapB family antitoxin [Candidatus Eremiobacteraeota bacterium]|nr:type II toxin-antitoxin system VapB family antitoxin [Candidatus Eremiobacteraeota bacterium]MCW5871067.1 type II toxin-antitoxin system VapB family antitoxin [Candidatus Eremiobacteraeota bacterium]